MDEGFNMRKRKSSSSSSDKAKKNTALSKRARRNPKSTHNTKKPSLELFWNLPSFLSKGDDAVCRRVSEQCNSMRRQTRLCNNTAAATSVCAVLMMWRKIKVFPSSLRRSKTIKNHLNFTFTFEFTLFPAHSSTWSYRWMVWNRVETKHVPATTSRSGEREESQSQQQSSRSAWDDDEESTSWEEIAEQWEISFRFHCSGLDGRFFLYADDGWSFMYVVVFISFVVSPFVLDTISSDLRISFGGRATTRALCCYDVVSRALRQPSPHFTFLWLYCLGNGNLNSKTKRWHLASVWCWLVLLLFNLKLQLHFLPKGQRRDERWDLAVCDMLCGVEGK